MSGCGAVETFEHEVQVEAGEAGQPVAGAQVRAEIGVRNVYEAATDAQGIARLALDTRHLGGWAKVIIEADGYERQSILVKLEQDSPPSVVKLFRPGEAPTATQVPLTPAASSEVGTVEATTATTISEVSGEAALPGELASVPAAERADYYSSRPALTIDPNQTYRATIQTSKGNIVLSLDAEAAPEHVNNFIFLSNQGFYDGLTFHRVEPGFVIQGGDPLGTGQGGPGYTIPGEFELTHSEGALAMARLPDQANPDRQSSGSQFYITLAPTPSLDGAYSVFGQVEEGMEVVRAIAIGDLIEHITIETVP